MRLFHLLWLFILWLNMDKTLQQNAKQCPLIHVDNNVQVFGDHQEATYGNVVQFSCRSRIQILSGPSEIYCDEYGEWSGNPPTCKEITCTVPRIENGYVPGDIKEYRENEILQFECNNKYAPTEGRPSKCIKIGSGAEWSPTPICEPIKCKLTPLEGTRYEPEYKNVFLPGDVLRVICGRKYWILTPQDTSVETTCRDNGEWTITPVCEEVTCSNRRDRLVDWWSVYWTQRITLDTTVRYSCRSGYKSTDGTNMATCTRDGWRPNPFCQEITCDREEVENAVNVNLNKQTYKYNEQAEYRCKDGYEGSPIRTCGGQGWTGTSGCTERPRNCGTPPLLADGDLSSAIKSQYSHNESVTYMCPLYYTMEGEPYRTCINGEWTGHMRCLRPCIVNEDDIRQHNITLKSSGNRYFAHDELIEFRCARGIPVGTVAMHQRCNGGVILLPTCQ